jgi:hypothetical protein
MDVDERLTETVSDQEDERESGSIYSEGDDYEVEEQSQKVKKRRQGPIDIKTLSEA